MKSTSVRIFVFKIAVTAALLALLFYSVDIGAMVDHARRISLISFVVAAFWYIVATIISSIRWSLLLRMRGISLPFMRLIAYNFSYTFYSIILPGGKVAAEGVRVYQVVRDAHDDAIRSKIIFPTLLDRALVVFSAACVATIFFLIMGYDVFPSLPFWFPYAAAGLVALLTLSAFLPVERFISLMLGVPIQQNRQPALHSLKEAFLLYRSNPAALLIATVLTVMMLTSLAYANITIASALGISAPFLLMLGIISTSMVAAFLPFTIGGVGIREGIFSYLLATAASVPLEVALSVSLIALVSSHLVTLLGGLVEFHRHFIR